MAVNISSTHMKMMMALRCTRTPITPMMKSAAVSASDSASTDYPPSTKHNGARDSDEQKYAGKLERQQIIREERLGNHPDGVELLQLLLVEITWNDELLRELGANDHHDRAGVDQDLHHTDELRIQHHIEGREAEHRVHQPQSSSDRTLARHERDRRRERDDSEQIEVKDVEERVVRLHHSPFGSSGSHISHTGCV